MCRAVKYKNTSNVRIDKCMRKFIENLKGLGVQTLACCCGHGKYPMTLVVDIGFSKVLAKEIFSGKQIPRKRNFYKKDKQGYYFIQEVKNDCKQKEN